MTTTTDRIGEVIEASTNHLLAQCYHLYGSPPLGALMRAGRQGEAVYGVVTGITTQSLDPGRKPIARGHQVESEEEVYQGNPQLARLLHTHLELAIVGHAQGDQLLPNLPPQPPRIHTFVYPCAPEEVRAFTASLDFLRLLLANGSPTTDEATASLLIMASQAHPDPYAFRLAAGQELARLLGSDPPRLNALLKRLAP